MRNDTTVVSSEIISDTVAVDSVSSDSVLIDSVQETIYGLIIENPVIQEPVKEKNIYSDGMSWVWLCLVVLFCAVALKFKNNARYLKAIVSDLTEVRVRQNAFDDTVKETSFLILLNILWVCCCGVLLWKTVVLTAPELPEYSFSIPNRPGAGIAVCTGMAGLYALLMNVAYWIIGYVFTDREHARLWIKGAGASQGLEVMLLLPLAAIALSYTPWTEIILEIADGVIILGKIIFIYKGFRIFFNQISSWMLFLYYLCSVEIVPLILTYLVTLQLCSVLL